MHDTGCTHPENKKRVLSVIERLSEKGLMHRLTPIEPGEAAQSWIGKIHHAEYIEAVRQSCISGIRFLGSLDTPISEKSYHVALAAAGGVLKAADSIMEGKITNAFCAVRPPGHHAEANQALGFCIFNNVAIAARDLQIKYGISKVAIIDWDVHHGNGTQNAFYRDPSVFYISLHQKEIYPGTGFVEERGEGDGAGFNMNFPLKTGTGDSEYIRIFEEQIAPVLVEFNPDFVLISAGFDAHEKDPLSTMMVTASGYAKITEILLQLAEKCCQGRTLSVLEGGYNLEALAESVYKHVCILTRISCNP